MAETWVIVVAAGSAERFGRPKQYEQLGETDVLTESVGTAVRHADGVIVVVTADHIAVDRARFPGQSVVAGGSTRSESVRAGLAAVPAAADFVLVHDAARPLASDEIYRAVIAALEGGADGALPVVPITDTLRDLQGAPVDRSRLVGVQTPQGFRFDVLQRAHRSEPDATDDASLVTAGGGTVVTVDGSPRNLKITTPDDLIAARALLAR